MNASLRKTLYDLKTAFGRKPRSENLGESNHAGFRMRHFTTAMSSMSGYLPEVNS